ncbi:MAG TPA: carboxymuconolactone decarboxylase family protein [Gaiellaceae bacterium]|nr:carboxymuconolactone decarboxylase family protein [Gaiellaceae bacterium]
MARIDVAESYDLTELPGTIGWERRIAGIRAHRPAAAQAVRDLAMALNDESTLPPRLVELVRIRIAFHNQCRSCMATRYTDGIDAGVTEELVCSLERPLEADDLSDAEKAALRYADLYATNHLAIDDAVYASLREHFDEGELVELAMRCAHMVGFGRMVATLAVTDDLPERFLEHREGPYTPWGGDVVVRPSPRSPAPAT